MTSIISTLHKKAQRALNDGQFQQAHRYIMLIFQEDQSFADGYFLMGMIASAHNNVNKAIKLIEQATKLESSNSEYYAQLAKHYALIEEHVKAQEAIVEAISIGSESALTFDTLGVSYSKIGLHQAAIPLYKEAVNRAPNNENFHYNLAISQTFVGDFQGARESHQRVLELNPNSYKSYAALSSLSFSNKPDNYIKNLASIYKNLVNAEDKLCVGHALAREYEKIKEYSSAFKYLQDAKQSKIDSINYNFEDDRAMFSSLNKNSIRLNNNNIKEGYDSQEPIFVVGMPRTGTTLVERILSGHSEIMSAGELSYFGTLVKLLSGSQTTRILDEATINATCKVDYKVLGQAYIDKTRHITGNTPKFVDKMPLNVLYVDFIIKALPNAKIICLDRNPLDTIVSNYRQFFSANSDSYNYAYDLVTCAKYYCEFIRLVRYFEEKYVDNFKVVNYEKLVNNPERHAKEMVEFCQLQWQESCLEIQDNAAPVATASAVQVRDSINNSSVGNWKKYEAHLDLAKEILTLNGIDWIREEKA